MWHGGSDEFISSGGQIEYLNRVKDYFGSWQKTDEVLRLFMAPGVGHCGGGKGPTPTATLDALIAWVEKGKAPERLLAVTRDKNTDAVQSSRPLCKYPSVARYKGIGSTDKATNFECANDY